MKSTVPVMTIVMLAIFATMVGVASTYPPGARFMTFVIGIPAIGLCLLQLGLDLYRRGAADPSGGQSDLDRAQEQVARFAGRRVELAMPSENAAFTDTDRDPRETVRREIVVWGWFLGFVAGVLLFGFRLAVPVFLIGFLRFQAEARWRSALIYGGAGAVAMYLLFERVLRVTLHNGFLTDFVLDLMR